MHFFRLINILKQRRKDLGITQEDLAMLSGIGLRTIKEFESGKGNPTLKTVNTLLSVVGMEIDFIVKR